MAVAKRPTWPRWTKISETPNKIDHIVPVSNTRKFLWGLWSKSDTKLYMTSNSAVYRYDEKPKKEKKVSKAKS